MAIKKSGSKWLVTSKDGSKVLGKHDTKKAALEQLRAIEASKRERVAKEQLVPDINEDSA